MSRTPGISRYLLSWLALLPLLSGCQSVPDTGVSVSSKSSLLAVDVRYPFPRSRDPSLVQVFFVRGPLPGGFEELPELVPASFVKESRAYLLDPEPGTYSLVAVTSLVAPPWNLDPVAGGVENTVMAEEIGHAVIFPAELIQRTETAIGSGEVAFMGALRVRRSDRINANAVFEDELQQRIAERIRPGVTSESGLAGRFSMTWTVDLEETSLSNDAADRESFFDDALTDLDDSPWAQVIARAAPPKATAARSRAPAPSPKSAAPIPETIASEPQVAVAEPTPATPETIASEPQVAVAEPTPATPETIASEPQVAVAEPTPATPETIASEPQIAVAEPTPAAPEPERRRFAGVPPDSPLAKIEFGMHHGEVREILGDPDDRMDRLTAKAWIPFYSGPGARLTDWIYDGVGRVVFSLHSGTLEVFDVVHDPGEPK